MQSAETKRIYWLSSFVLTSYVFMGTISHSALYADGANGFLSTLANNNIVFVDTGRYYATFMSYLLYVLGIKAGITFIPLLSFLYSFGNAFANVVFWFLSLRMCYRKNNPLYLRITVILFCLVLSLTGFFMQIESIIAAATFWLLFLYFLWYDDKNENWKINFGIVVVSILSTRLYSSFAFFGILLLFIIMYRSILKQIKLSYFFMVEVVLLLYASLIGFIGIIYPRDPRNAASFLSSLFHIDSEVWTVFFLLFLCIVIAYIRKNIFLNKHPKITDWLTKIQIALEYLTGILFMFFSIIDSREFATHSYHHRCINLIVPLGIAILSTLTVVFKTKLPQELFKKLTVFFLIATLIIAVVPRIEYIQYLKELAAITSHENGLIPASKYKVNERYFYWGWNIPSESVAAQLIFSNTLELRSVVVQDREWIQWEPYNSYNIDSYPDLSQYGVTYNVGVKK